MHCVCSNLQLLLCGREGQYDNAYLLQSMGKSHRGRAEKDAFHSITLSTFGDYHRITVFVFTIAVWKYCAWFYHLFLLGWVIGTFLHQDSTKDNSSCFQGLREGKVNVVMDWDHYRTPPNLWGLINSRNEFLAVRQAEMAQMKALADSLSGKDLLSAVEERG